MDKRTRFEVTCEYALAEKKRVLMNATSLLRDLEHCAKKLKLALESEDLSRIAQVVGLTDPRLTTQAEKCFELLHLLESLKTASSE